MYKTPFINEQTTSFENGNGSGKELFLDTKGTCFLCLKDAGGVGEKECDAMSEFCLRSIYRYLGIHSSSILLRSLKMLKDDDGKTGTSDLNEKRDFSVVLCATCSSLAKKMSELIHQAEITEMLLSQYLQQFQQVLTLAEREELGGISKSKRFYTKMTSSCANSVEVDLVKTLRQEAKQNSSTKLTKYLETSLPKLRIHRAKLESPTAVVPTPSAPLHVKQEHDDGTETMTLVGGASELPDPHLDSPSQTHHLGSTNPKQWILDLCTKECKVFPGKRLQCPYCGRIRSDANIRSHLILVHLDKCFAHIRFPHTPELKFRNLCRVTLREEKNRAALKLRSQAISKGSNSFSCFICDKEFSGDIGFKYHFVLNHPTILEEKWIRLQGGNFKLPNPLPLPPRTARPPAFPQNSITNRKTARYFAAKTPVSNLFAVNVFQSFCKEAGTKEIGSSRFQCALCPLSNKLYTELVIKQHLVNVHPEKFFETIRPPTVAEPTFQWRCKQILKLESNHSVPGQKRFQCPVCKKCSPGSYGLRYHLVVEHYDFIKEKIARFQAKVKSERGKSDNNKILQTLSIYCAKIMNGGVAGYKCSLCDDIKNAYRESTVHTHLVDAHPELLFADKRLEEISEEMFAICCKNVLEVVGSSGAGSVVQKNLCPHCNLKPCDGYSLKHHLVMSHCDILEGTLRSVQQETIREREQEIKGETMAIPESEHTIQSESRNENLVRFSRTAFQEDMFLDESMEASSDISSYEEVDVDNFHSSNDMDYVEENHGESFDHSQVQNLGSRSLSHDDMAPWNHDNGRKHWREGIKGVQLPEVNDFDFMTSEDVQSESLFECGDVEMKATVND